jgi:virginiamycin B lyase
MAREKFGCILPFYQFVEGMATTGRYPVPYGIFVDEKDMVWVTDWDVENGTQTLFRFDPTKEKFEAFPLPSDHSDIHQMNGRPGEVWAAEPGVDKRLLIRTGE